MGKLRKRGKSWQIDYLDPTGKRIRKTFEKKKEAEAELAKRVALIAEGRYLDVKVEYTSTMGELLDKYQENHKHQPAFYRNKSRWLKNFRDYFGADKKVVDIRYVHLETYRNRLRQKLTRTGTMRKDSSINRELSCLRHVFKKAVAWEMLGTSPFDMGESLLLKENNQRLRFLTEEEIPRLLEACPTHLRRIVECALHTGMRRGEILSLRWSQVRNGFIYLEKTKTNEARQIPINDRLAELFKEMRKERNFGQDHVFVYRRGEDKLKGEKPVRKRLAVLPAPEAVSSIRTAFISALERAGIRDFRFHDLRHTFASHLVMQGASIKEVQELLGHKTLAMTTRYAHLSQEHKKKAVNLLNKLTDRKGTAVASMSQIVTKSGSG